MVVSDSMPLRHVTNRMRNCAGNFRPWQRTVHEAEITEENQNARDCSAVRQSLLPRRSRPHLCFCGVRPAPALCTTSCLCVIPSDKSPRLRAMMEYF